jgi:Zn-dependent protease with chaperone function
MIPMSARYVLATVALLGACSTASAQSAMFWEITRWQLESADSSIVLRDNEHKTVATVSTSQLRKLYEVEEKIGAAAQLSNVSLAISSDEKPNAFAGAKDGKRGIAFTLGMLRVLGEDEDMMAAVMGHEFGHLVKNHSGRTARSAAADVVGILLSIVAGRSIANPLAADLASRAGNIAGRTVIHSYDRDQEREADAFGIEAMTKAGFDPQGAVRYWNSLASQGSGGFWTTHPASDERLANVRQLATMYSRRIDRTPLPAAQGEERATGRPGGCAVPTDVSQVSASSEGVGAAAVNEQGCSDNSARPAKVASQLSDNEAPQNEGGSSSGPRLHQVVTCELGDGSKAQLSRITCIRQGGREDY